MHYFFGGLALLLFAIFAARAFIKADPKKLAQTMRSISGWAMVLLSTMAALRGLFPIALPLAFVAAMLLGRGSPFGGLFPGGFGPFAGRSEKSEGQKSKVQTDHLQMALDHDSGEMDGLVIKGAHHGKRLSSLDEGELAGLYADYQRADQQSAQLLAAYLDRMHSDWRPANGEGASGFEEQSSSYGAMTREEAFDILGLKADAGPKEIADAHRKLMKKLHPDQGGSTYLAAKINQAKDVLMA